MHISEIAERADSFKVMHKLAILGFLDAFHPYHGLPLI